PLMALASAESLAGANCSEPASFLTVTSAFTERTRVPLAPFTVIWSAATFTSTPCGTVIGIFPTRDIARLLPLGHVAQHFATDTGSSCFAVGHHALGRGDDSNTQAIHDLRDRITTAVDAQARTADALD